MRISDKVNMGAFVCQVSEIDWLVSRKIGVYGNREGSERDGKVVYFDKTKKSDEIIQSIIEDLIGMMKGDIVFFHVIDTAEGESSIHGIYKVCEEPFYNNKEKFWKSSPHFIYPYRFCFEPHPNHTELCKYDASILVSEFYRSIENRDVRSILTLEREVRGAAHAVKKITREDAEVIEKLLYRDFNYRHLKDPIDFQPIQMQMEPLRNHIKRIGEIEFAIKAFVAHELGRKSESLIRFIPACKNAEYDFLIESFIGQTTRKPTDILCISNDDAEKTVTIMEVKTDQAKMNDLVQSLKYLELFKLRNLDRGSLTYKMSICLLAQRFHQELINYVFLRNNFLPQEEITLLKYTPIQNGRNATFVPQLLQKPQLIKGKIYPQIHFDELSEISSKPDQFYAKTDKKIPPRTNLELKLSEGHVTILQKYYFNGGKKTALGHVLIYAMHGKCASDDFARFMNLVNKEINFVGGDLKAVEPILIAENYDDLVNFFIDEYNTYETRARRQPISAYILSNI